MRGLLVSLLLFILVGDVLGEEQPSPLSVGVVVDEAEMSAVPAVTVTVRNESADEAVLIRSVEFENQLPESRYFYHGIYGSISKRDDGTYQHHPMQQQLSRPVGNCFLLPGQAAKWQRTMRRQPEYRASLAWSSIPVGEVATRVWAEDPDASEDGFFVPYLPLAGAAVERYQAKSAGGDRPLVVIEGDLPTSTADVPVRCAGGCHTVPIPIDSPAAHPALPAAAVDFVIRQLEGEERVVPCILNKEVFQDLIEVKQESTNMYFSPGVTAVPADRLRQILDRAVERGLPVQLTRIDPNSLGQRLVLTIGVQVTPQGRLAE